MFKRYYNKYVTCFNFIAIFIKLTNFVTIAKFLDTLWHILENKFVKNIFHDSYLHCIKMFKHYYN